MSNVIPFPSKKHTDECRCDECFERIYAAQQDAAKQNHNAYLSYGDIMEQMFEQLFGGLRK